MIISRSVAALTILLAFSRVPSFAATAKWPQLAAVAGSYDVSTAAEIADLGALGFRLHVIKAKIPTKNPIWSALEKAGSKYIDGYPWILIYRGCGISPTNPRCNMTPVRERDVLEKVRAHFEETAANPNIVGYWILDDYPKADIRNLLKEIRKLLQNVNRRSSISRPAVCGFGGVLDIKGTDAPSEIRYRNMAERFINFSPETCDAVALYPYAYQQTPVAADAIDWSMSQLLPYALRELRARGWNPVRQPLIGMPQAFYQEGIDPHRIHVVPPRRQDITKQMIAYCRAGASAILFYSWHDSHDDWHEGYNTPFIRDALVDGLKLCKAAWAHQNR